MMFRHIVTLAYLSGIAAPTFAQRELRDIPNPDPEFERETFKLADGFEVNLFAADPMIPKPIQMNFDPHGRLWVASSEIYPQIKPGEPSNDKIIVLEDTDGDGKGGQDHRLRRRSAHSRPASSPATAGATSRTRRRCCSLSRHRRRRQGRRHEGRPLRLRHRGHAPHHPHLPLGPGRLAVLHQSIYIHTHVETPHGVRRHERRRNLAVPARDRQLEVFARGLVNTWGHDFDR